MSLDLSHNKLPTLDYFSTLETPALKSLNLEDNRLEIRQLEKLTSLKLVRRHFIWIVVPCMVTGIWVAEQYSNGGLDTGLLTKWWSDLKWVRQSAFYYQTSRDFQLSKFVQMVNAFLNGWYCHATKSTAILEGDHLDVLNNNEIFVSKR